VTPTWDLLEFWRISRCYDDFGVLSTAWPLSVINSVRLPLIANCQCWCFFTAHSELHVVVLLYCLHYYSILRNFSLCRTWLLAWCLECAGVNTSPQFLKIYTGYLLVSE